MCRYADHAYLSHYVCVPCRISWKAERRPTSPPLCRGCGLPGVHMGRDFKAPRKADVNGWRKVGIFVAQGVRFDSCGCGGPGPAPATLAEAKALVVRRERHAAVTGRDVGLRALREFGWDDDAARARLRSRPRTRAERRSGRQP